MIGPVPPPPMEETAAPWDNLGDPNQAAWRERERRQRTVRVLMMFLLMLLLMDGEEQNTRRRKDNLRTRRPHMKKSMILDEDVYQARQDQEERLVKLTRGHPRFKLLMEKNGGSNYEAQIRKWAEQQEQEPARTLSLRDDSNDEKDGREENRTADMISTRTKSAEECCGDDDKTVYHYPWNATGFYRGQWVRHDSIKEEGDATNDDDVEAKDNQNDHDPEDHETRLPGRLSPHDLEGPVGGMLQAREDSIGVHLLPEKYRVNMNLTEQELTAGVFGELWTGGGAKNKMTKSSFLPQPELNFVVENAEEDNEPDMHVTLSKDSGRAAFQFYSRAIPAMKELSFVDGFVKLYDSNTVGYATQRDTLLRVRGVLIHSIGRISLSANARLDRSALILHDYDKKRNEAAPKKDVRLPLKSVEDVKTRRRLLQETLSRLDDASDDDTIARVRDETMSLYPLDVVTDGLGSGSDWNEISSFEDLDPEVMATKSRSQTWLSKISKLLQDLNAHEIHVVGDLRKRPSLSPLGVIADGLGFDWEEISSFEDLDPELMTKESRSRGWWWQVSKLFHDWNSHERLAADDSRRRLRETLVSNETGIDNATNTTLATVVGERRMIAIREGDGSAAQKLGTEGSTKRSRIVVPYPFVPDDKQESVRNTKSPAFSRKMPPREQIYEANANGCEFQVVLDTKETEWSVGEWKTLMKHHVQESMRLSPLRHKTTPDEEDRREPDAEDTKKASHVKRKHHASKHTPASTGEASPSKPAQDQALVMLLTGSISSPNCDFSASLNATAIRTDWERTTRKAINYSFYMMLTCLTQIVVLLRQLLHTQSPSAATRVSLFCIGWQAVLDALLCLGHIYLSLAMQPLFTAFASVAFFKLLIFCVIEMKYLSIIVQARNASNGGQITTEVLRRQVAMIHLRFYVALVTSFLAFFQVNSNLSRTLYILGLYSFWIPQIVQNIITEAKRPMHHYYIYGISLTRLVAPLYIFGLRNNFLKEVYPDSPTNPLMCQLLIAWVCVQTAVLIAQGKYGARFMIPARFLPPKFDYSRPIPPSLLPPEVPSESMMMGGGAPDGGPHPLSPLSTPSSSSSSSSSQALMGGDESPPKLPCTTGTRNRMKGSRQQQKETTTMTTESNPPPIPTLDCVICCNAIDIHNRRGYMLAPCDHIFHRECLVHWMDVKMECPVCRKELPAL